MRASDPFFQKPEEKPDETDLLRSGRIRVFDPEFLRTQVHAVAIALLTAQLPIALLMEQQDQLPQRFGRTGSLRGHDADGFVAQGRLVAGRCPEKFHGPAEASFPGIEAGELMFLPSRIGHG